MEIKIRLPLHEAAESLCIDIRTLKNTRNGRSQAANFFFVCVRLIKPVRILYLFAYVKKELDVQFYEKEVISDYYSTISFCITSAHRYSNGSTQSDA